MIVKGLAANDRHQLAREIVCDPHFLRRILLRMYWDNEENPSVEVPVGDFFGTGFEYKHYIAEYLGMSSGGYYCYFPMPFNKKACIEVVNETGQEIYAFYYHIDYQKLEESLDHDEIVLKLNKGWNSLLLKIENNFGGYAFFARILDINNDLKIRTDKKI